VREPDARGFRGHAGTRDRVRAHSQARHPGQAGKLVGQALPRRSVLTPAAELLMAGYFMVAVEVAIEHGHYLSVPFLLLFLFGFGYVGTVSAWQAWLGQSMRRFWQRPEGAPRFP